MVGDNNHIMSPIETTSDADGINGDGSGYNPILSTSMADYLCSDSSDEADKVNGLLGTLSFSPMAEESVSKEEFQGHIRGRHVVHHMSLVRSIPGC